ncbi:MAG: hypothetical protein IJM61_06410 [Firmicutes bacterium]|nr:hypothetical protein [Bacillota bacterium]
MEEKRSEKQLLFERQKQLLDTFLEHGAISKAQYNKSLGDLKEKMGIEDNAPGQRGGCE